MSEIALSPDDRVLAIAELGGPRRAQRSGWIRLIDTESWELVGTLVGHGDVPVRVTFSSDGKRLASIESGGFIKIWDVTNLRQIGSWHFSAAGGASLAFSRDDRWLLCHTADPDLVNVDAVLQGAASLDDPNLLRQGMVMAPEEQQPTYWQVNGLGFSADGARLAVGYGNTAIYLFDVATGGVADIPCLPWKGLIARSFSPDLRLAAVPDRYVTVWDMEAKKTRYRLAGSTQGSYGTIFSPDGELLATCHRDSRIKVWHLPTGKLWATTVQLETVPTQLAFSSDSKLLASGAGGDAEGLTVVWQLPDQRPSGSSSDKSSGVVSADPVAKDGARATTSAKSPAARMPPANAQLAAALRKAGKLVREQRADTDEFRRTLQGVAGDLPILPSSANLAPDGWLNLTLNSSGTGFDAYRFTSTLDGPADLCIAFVEPREETNWYVLPVTGQMEAANDFDREDALDLPGVDKGRSVIFQLLAQGTIAPRAEYILWFATKATEAVELKLLWKVVPRGTIQDKPTSDSVAKELGLKTPLRFLVSSSAEPLKRLSALRHGAPVRSLAFSPDGTTLATGGGDNQVRLWERTRGTLRQTVPGAMVVFAPDGLSIATAATIDGPTSVAIWDATSGQQCHRLEGAHLRLVEQLAFSPDGSRLASGCRGGIVTVWDTATGRQAWQPELAVSPRTNRHRRLSGHQAGVLAAAFSPKDDLLVTGGSDSFVLQWSMASGGMAGQIEWHRPSTRCGLQRRRQVDRLGRERQYDSSLHLCSRARRAHHESPRP